MPQQHCLTSESRVRHLLPSAMVTATLLALGACGTTSRMEPYKQTDAVIGDGEQVVVLARRHHATHEAEQRFVDCISDALERGAEGIAVHPSTEFEDKMYPWFEPSTAPLSTDDLGQLLEKPGVLEQVRETGVRFVVWLDGSTDRVASGGGISCAAGVGGAGCMGLAWWEDDARYDATVWDMQELVSAGTIYHYSHAIYFPAPGQGLPRPDRPAPAVPHDSGRLCAGPGPEPGLSEPDRRLRAGSRPRAKADSVESVIARRALPF
jgi:hypothetical protein